jgi:hypothetical protein
MQATFSALPGWTFEIDETSAGIFEVTVTDERGARKFQKTGSRPKDLLRETRGYALWLIGAQSIPDRTGLDHKGAS